MDDGLTALLKDVFDKYGITALLLALFTAYVWYTQKLLKEAFENYHASYLEIAKVLEKIKTTLQERLPGRSHDEG